MDCLILGNHTQGLGVIRSLRNSGYKVHMVNDVHVCLSRFSRYLKSYHILPKSTFSQVHEPDVAQFLVQKLLSIAFGFDKVILFCMDEDLIHFVYSHKQALAKRFIIPENDIISIIDKYTFAKAMENIGLSSPETFLLSDISRLPDQTNKRYLYKGRRGVRFKKLMKSKGAEISSSKDLDGLRATILSKIEESDVLIQGKLENNKEVLSCCGLAVDGKLLRVFQYVKLRQHPNEFGTGTFLKSIRDDRITDMSMRILEHFSYTGIFEIEFVLSRDGSCHVLEMNPRTWKSINYATDCGQNLCLAYCDYLLKGIMPEKNFDYQVGRYWVHLSQDIYMLVKNKQWPGYSLKMSCCVFDTKDPLPFVVEILLMPLILCKI